MYERYGFAMMHLAEMKFDDESPGEEWWRLVKDLQANPAAIMWRPIGGRYVHGETVVPVGRCTTEGLTRVLLCCVALSF